MQDKTDAAIQALTIAARLYGQANDEVGIGGSYRDIGICYSHRGDHTEALRWLKKSNTTLRGRLDAIAELGITQTKVGECYFEMGDLPKATEWLEKGLM